MQTQKSLFPPHLILTAMMVLILLLVSAGAWFYQSQKQAMREVMIRDLSSVAQLKVDQLVSWRAERLGNAELIINSPVALPIIASFLAAPQDQSREVIRSRFMSFQANHGYQDVVLLDPAGTIRLTMTGRDRALSDCCVDIFHNALTQRRPLFTHVYSDPMTDEPSLAVIAPLYPDPQPETEAMGALLFISNMREQLFPMIKGWPLPSDSVEAYIVARDGDEVQVLSDVRHRENATMDLRIPLQKTNNPAVAAVLGHQGIFEGKDYRGVDVVASVLPVPGSSWFILVKKDAVEIFAEWRFRALMISGLLATLVLSIGAMGLLLWQRERKQHFARLYAAEALLRANVERHSIILKAIGEAVIATDADGRVELLNQGAEQLTGWTEGEARGHQLDEVFRIISEETRSPVESPVTKVLKEGVVVGLANHTLLIGRDGSERPIADSGAPIFDDQGHITGVVLVFRDQTEERRIEQELRESATTFKKLFEDSSDAILLIDSTGVFVECNQAALNLLKMSRREFINQSPVMISPEFQPNGRRSSEAAQDMVDQAHAKGLHRFDWTCVNSQGGAFIVDVSLMPIIINGQTMLHTTWRNITERKQAEEERESLRKTAEALAEVFLGLGRESQQNMDRIVRAAGEVTGSAAALYNRLDDTGCSIEVWSGHQLPPDMPRADTPQGHICYEATIHGQDRTVVIGNLEGTDYERTDPAVGKYGLKAYLGHPIHLRGVAIGALAVVDIRPRSFTPGEIGAIQMLAKALSLEEERCFAEQELRQSEERFRGILQNVDTVAVQGYALDGTVRYWNRAAESFYGYTAEEALGRNLLDLIIPPAMRGEVSAAIQHMAQTGEAIPPSELILMRKDGSLIPVYSSHVMVQVLGKDVELYCIDVDLTELKQTGEEKQKLQDQLHQAQKMESVGRLAGGVAHDFNNNLAAIIGASELMLGADNLTEKQRKYLNMILTAAGRAGNSTKKLLVFSRRGTKASSPVDCATITEDTVALLQQTVDKAITISLDKRALQTTVIGDESELQSALMNIGINAAQAMPGGGELNYKLENLDLDDEYCNASPFAIIPGRYLEIAVRDTGCGMSPELTARIFEPFFTTKKQGKGTGLGLAMVYGTVQKHGGAITVYSEVERGTIFHIYLPLTGKMVGPKSETPLVVSGSGTILVVDDEEVIRTTTAALLESLGYRVMSAANGQEGVITFRKAKDEIDLVILDMIMPVMGGRETFGQLREIDPSIPILIASGFAKEEDMAELTKQAVTGFLNKPFRKGELAEKVGNVLGHHNLGADKSHSTPRQLTREDLQSIPFELKEAVAAAVAVGNMKQIKHHIKTIASLNSALAAPLEALAEICAYDQLIELFAKE